MKDKFFYITVAVFLLTLGITGFLYYNMSLKSVVEYDNAFIDSRNDVISQIDTLSNTLNTADDEETVDGQIQLLVSKRAALEEIFNNESHPNRNGEEIVAANKNFLDKTQEIIILAQEYRNSFMDDTVDPVEKMTAYNAKVSELNTIIDQIRQILDENNSGLLSEFI
ncbi:hypothetical protein JW978_03120 [Candidatus Dojkabacteria bacterium]|nr:hypothetical protein [Candidatus Dojkabacteria bacterium]